MATYKFLDPETLQTTTAANGGVRALVTGVGNGAVGASSIKFDNGSMASQALKALKGVGSYSKPKKKYINKYN